jgi:hypothetical protein
MPDGDPEGEWVHTSRIGPERAVPLAALASVNDVEHARGLLAVHQPRAVVRRICSGCGEPWPCMDALYGWAVTGIPPSAGPGAGPGAAAGSGGA